MASKDLDKLMGKLKKKEEPKVEESKEEEEFEDDDLEDDDLEDDYDETPSKTNVKSSPKPDKPSVKQEKDQDEDQNLVRNEVEVLQNNGIFRRELLLTLKELVDVHSVNTQVLIDIKKKVYDEDGTEEKEE